MRTQRVITNWDRAYSQGKYDGDGAIPFVIQIVQSIRQQELQDEVGFYPGCGNGRNFIPLVEAGLRLKGNDISPVAISQLKERLPEADVEVGDFFTMKSEPFSYLISIQLFQHGNQAQVERLFAKVWELLRPGGLLCLRVNSIHTQIAQGYEVVETTPNGGFTILYQSGPKRGQEIHFYSAEEIVSLTKDNADVLLPLQEEFIPREDGSYWVQWETIVRKKG